MPVPYACTVCPELQLPRQQLYSATTSTRTMAEKEFVERYRPHAEPLDDNFYHLGAEEAVFFKSWTGINDDDKLKEHILAVQRGAYEANAP